MQRESEVSVFFLKKKKKFISLAVFHGWNFLILEIFNLEISICLWYKLFVLFLNLLFG